ncbi:MAG: phosphatidylserine decarboxylase family protein [Bacteroidales bacterium]|jgi:phosphatidylserine decarboxylase|nr:phosphatidylserine decarboxylase family protein [Bacteroidales bacterium]MDD2203932.1 phosphatidylserine decarboxylase family protein [Bacteroidales bacterium]MDD3913053.1 phosphatidylserine decarboxylase family protein [Bacteroidales bacterium]MDD4632968.1 phosphatidylserine decarboxylase family protein [Bacteroidales bacterium]
MKIHKEGKRIIFYGLCVATVLLILLILFLLIGVPNKPEIICLCIIMFVIICLSFFYRHPSREFVKDDCAIFIPADGKIVAVEKVIEKDYFEKPMLQVSIFMSIFNVHINWVPVSGTVMWKNHTDGENYPAYNPKSSNLNEKCQTVIKIDDGKEIMVTQIAGIMARRVVNQKTVGEKLIQGDELGIIKFGSRVDVFLPTDANIQVKVNQRVRAMKTVLVKL